MPDDLRRDRIDAQRRRADNLMRAAAAERWSTDDAYWRENYHDRPYTAADLAYDAYRPAYRYGCEASFIYHPLPWDDEVDFELSLGWLQARGDSRLTWEHARDAVREGYEKARG
ncbi:MAG TPA: hypothetical protein VH559_03335 [Gemmatimonadaceae bacterium]